MKPALVSAFVLASLSFATGASAQAYRCTVNGAVVFQQGPCAEGGVKLAVRQPSENDKLETLIAQRKIAISMTAQQARRSWGPPSKINKTVSASGTSEQWIYDRDAPGRTQYVYLSNGVVTSMQSPGEP